MIPRARVLVTALVLASVVPVVSAAARRWTVDDFVLVESAGEFSVSRDGSLAAWVRTSVEKVGGVETTVSNVWLGRLDSATSAPLTRGTDRVSVPAFSPDGAHVAFLSTRPLPKTGDDDGSSGDDDAGDDDAETQLWAIPTGGGEAFPVTRFDRAVRAFGWIDASNLIVAAQESPSAWELERKEAKDDSVVVDDVEHEPPVRLFRVALDGDTVTRLTRDDDWIDRLAVSPDGTLAVVTAQQSLSYEFDERVPPRTFVVDLATGARTPLFEDGKLRPTAIRFAPDGAGFYFLDAYSRDPRYRQATVLRLWYHDLASGRDVRVAEDWPRGIGEAEAYGPIAGGVVALLADGVRYRPALYRRTAAGFERVDLAGEHAASLDTLAVSPDGRRIVYRSSSATVPPQAYVAALDGPRLETPRKLTDLNRRYDGKPTGRVEIVRWKGANDEEVEGLLHYPFDRKEGERRPLVVLIHGGPSGVDRDSWDADWADLELMWQERGAFVLQVNYHGSSNYGLDWVESIGGGKYYDLEVPDIERGVDAMVARGLADPDRLAVSGWSNGGILSAALVTETRRYKAASIGAADVEWFSDWANVDFGAAFDNYYFGGAPWEIPDVYRAKSPFFRLTEVTTPTIVFTGTEDRSVPPHESWSLFRAMQQIGKAPVRLVLFPGEPHGPKVIAHRRRKIEEDVAWFERYLFGSAPATNPSVPDDSLLAARLAVRAAAARDGVLGEDAGGAPVPETVRIAGLEVGRFEVTRAQYHAFDPSYPVEAGAENLPATNVGFERALAYVVWLTGKTGTRFRLPTVAEAQALADAVDADDGNTLDLWVGYTPNPDDAVRAREAAAALGPGALLLPVGSRPAAPADAPFDLDGNAAEWAVAPDGAGVPAGPSADRSSDDRARTTPEAAYVGLRVMVDPGGATPGTKRHG